MILRWIKIYQLSFTKMTGHLFHQGKESVITPTLLSFCAMAGSQNVYLICIYFSARKQHKNDSAGRIQMFKSFLVVVFASWGKNVPVVTQDDLS